MSQLRDELFFENNRASPKQIMYLKVLNYLVGNCSVKQFKSLYLPDLMRHGDINAEDCAVATRVYFIKNSIDLINTHLTYRDQELVLQLLSFIDQFKCSDNEEISEAAFETDIKVKFNIGISGERLKA